MDNKKNIAMVINGEFPTNRRIIDKIKSAEKVIAVDGATNSLIDQDIIPSIAIGDFDSIRLSYKDKVSEILEAPSLDVAVPITKAPLLDSSVAIAIPIPLLAPVTKTTLLLISIFSYSLMCV